MEVSEKDRVISEYVCNEIRKTFDLDKPTQNADMSNSVKKRKDSVLNIDESSKNNTNISGSPVEKTRWRVIDFIGSHPGCSIYKISHSLKLNYSTVFSIVRELSFCRLIISKKQFNKTNSQWFSVFFLPHLNRGVSDYRIIK